MQVVEKGEKRQKRGHGEGFNPHPHVHQHEGALAAPSMCRHKGATRVPCTRHGVMTAKKQEKKRGKGRKDGKGGQ